MLKNFPTMTISIIVDYKQHKTAQRDGFACACAVEGGGELRSGWRVGGETKRMTDRAV
ncbi:hypothetical protein SAICODRAFT_29983 [Saitoella complicata NRRL Y-17804]|uniref:uncharacterized protein n=1 Tax=Saitoella complicata (strain BCRC 22490 / CBS 7301 / JCM 7358 / NBRC 10748 / NRRL Y-17804) TaxID=698492 RepID=UPI00086744BA|nr:uncharacterized protein SAICODRAFT_29983 [Saitoella complicata NRRL Y-17804]ODQ53602.1 hypothetical protein SAICODRAFT_29983 [Saitoella complicata NRRL Y-17804]